MRDADVQAILSKLGSEPRRSSEVADALGWPRRTMGGRMRALEQRGLVRREVVRDRPSPRSDVLYGWALA